MSTCVERDTARPRLLAADTPYALLRRAKRFSTLPRYYVLYSHTCFHYVGLDGTDRGLPIIAVHFYRALPEHCHCILPQRSDQRGTRGRASALWKGWADTKMRRHPPKPAGATLPPTCCCRACACRYCAHFDVASCCMGASASHLHPQHISLAAGSVWAQGRTFFYQWRSAHVRQISRQPGGCRRRRRSSQ